MELFIAIALLCGNPSRQNGSDYHTTDNVQACQKYYVKCVTEGGSNVTPSDLANCILYKKKYGGDK